MRKSEEEKLKREEVKMKARGRVAGRTKEGDSTHYSAGPSDLKHCQASSVLKEDKTGEHKFGNKIIPEFIRKTSRTPCQSIKWRFTLH